jgi:hypothetical protein
VNVGEIPLELGCATPPVVMHHRRFSRTPGSTACDVDLFHATIWENSVFDNEAEDEDEEELSMDGAIASAVPVVADAQGHGEKRKCKEKLGPVLAVRASNRIIKDGRSMIEKAQELKKNKNLEKPKGMPHGFCNSFAILDNAELLGKACDAGLSFGNSQVNILETIDAIKHKEVDRLVSFRENNPGMFLPPNLGVEVGSVLSPD